MVFMTCTISDDEILDLFCFLFETDVGYCDICGWSFNVRLYGHTAICRDCASKMIEEGKLGVCKECGEILPIEELCKYRNPDGTVYLYCDRCAHNYLTVCRDCGKIMLRYSFDAHRVVGIERPYYVCESCASNYPRCERCGDLVEGELIDGWCKSCYDDAKWEGDGERYDYHDWDCCWNYYNDDGSVTFKPLPDTVYMGTELEIDTSHNMSTATTCSGLDRHLGGLVHFERDGSLSNRGIEIISMPMTLKKHMEFAGEFKSAFDYVTNRNYYCDNHTGLHVHVSTSMLSVREHKRLLYILDKFRSEVVKLSRRTSSYALYHRIQSAVGKGDWEDFKPTGADLDEYLEWIQRKAGHGIYLNYNGYPNQIEFRMFGGTLDITTYIGSIQFVHRCIESVQCYSLDELREMSFNDVFYGKYKELDELIDKTKDLVIRECSVW